MTELVRQHLIDPEICIRCNTCEETCPIDAISHDARNYVVNFEICNWCNDCIGPCPTGAIDNYRNVARDRAYSLAEQLTWDTLPAPVSAQETAAGETPAEVSRLTEIAQAGQGGPATPPWSAAHPYINLFSPQQPTFATVSGNHRITAHDAASDIRHIVLDFSSIAFPVLEGQSIGIIPPGTDESGRAHTMRLYSVASPRDGERPGYNNLSLTVKRVTEDHEGRPVRGLCSNYLCDLTKGDRVQVCGPYGTSFLMPNHPGSSLLMICTGTGSAPMRAMTERRRRRLARDEGGRLMLFFGARAAGELPYFGNLTKLPRELIDINLAFSRVPDQPKQYVQDKIRERHEDVFRMLKDENCYIYLCGLKGMERGVDEAFRDICRSHGEDWQTLLPQLKAHSRYHVETY